MFPAQSCRISRRKVSHRLPSAVDTYVHTHSRQFPRAAFFNGQGTKRSCEGRLRVCVRMGQESRARLTLTHREECRIDGFLRCDSRSLLACGGIIRQQGTVIWIALQQVPGIESTRAPDEVQLTCSLYTLLPRPGFFTLPSYVSFPPLLFLSSLLLSLFSVPLEKARLVSPQRALLQVPDWLLNWHSLKYPSNACRERYVWTKRTCWRQHQHQHQQQQRQQQRRDRRRWRCRPALRNGLYC